MTSVSGRVEVLLCACVLTTQAYTQAIRYQCFNLAEFSVSIIGIALLSDQHARNSAYQYLEIEI